MNKKELLKPRYKVIADYPGSAFNIGEVLSFIQEEGQELYCQWPVFDGFDWMYISSFKEYPHLFRLMPWWEERKKKDLPEYVKIRGAFFKVDKWDARNSENIWAHIGKRCYYSDICTPATKEDYESYLTTNKLNP